LDRAAGAGTLSGPAGRVMRSHWPKPWPGLRRAANPGLAGDDRPRPGGRLRGRSTSWPFVSGSTMKLAVATCAAGPPWLGPNSAVPTIVPWSATATNVRPGGSWHHLARASSSAVSLSHEKVSPAPTIRCMNRQIVGQSSGLAALIDSPGIHVTPSSSSLPGEPAGCRSDSTQVRHGHGRRGLLVGNWDRESG
jgi:hypothetical protein